MYTKNSPDRAGLGASLSLGLLSLAPLPAQSTSQRELPQDPPAATAPNVVQPLQFPKDPFVERLQQIMDRRASTPEGTTDHTVATGPQQAPVQVDRDFGALRNHHSTFAQQMRAEREARQARSATRVREALSRPAFDENLDQEVIAAMSNAKVKAAEGARNWAATAEDPKSAAKASGNSSAEKQRAPTNDQDPAHLQAPAHHDFSNEPMIITPSEPTTPNATPPMSAARTEHFWKQTERAMANAEQDSLAADVYLCKRPANLFSATVADGGQDLILSAFDYLAGSSKPSSGIDLTHHWIKAPTVEAGLGNRDGGVPGQGGSSGEVRASSSSFGRTAIINHAGESAKPNAQCMPVRNVDPECVTTKLQIGAPRGFFIPFFQDCQAAAKSIIDACKPKKE